MKLFNWINENIWFVSIFTLILGGYLNTFLSKNKELLLKIADNKRQCYAEFINILYGFSAKTDEVNEVNEANETEKAANEKAKNEQNTKYHYAKSLVILYGSKEVIERLAICEINGINFNIEEDRELYIDLIEEMKRDIEDPKILNTWGSTLEEIALNREDIDRILFTYKQD